MAHKILVSAQGPLVLVLSPLSLKGLQKVSEVQDPDILALAPTTEGEHVRDHHGECLEP